jgi:hypothetical protein
MAAALPSLILVVASDEVGADVADGELGDVLGDAEPAHQGARGEELFEVWHDRYEDKLRVEKTEARARVEKLVEEQKRLILARALLPPLAAAGIDGRIARVAREITELYAAPTRPNPPLGTWGSSPG